MKKLPLPKPINLQKPCIACGSSRGVIYFLHENHNGFVRCNRCDVALYSADELETLANINSFQGCDQ
jgi:hypothetical protein